jgi:predicted GH43/DUF377 family glycosyl hydrolase
LANPENGDIIQSTMQGKTTKRPSRGAALSCASLLLGIATTLPCAGHAQDASLTEVTTPVVYPDGRPSATLRMDAQDQGVILKHGDGPGQCDVLGAREALIFEEKGVYHLFYDGAGPKGWLACLATSKDLKTWEKKGPALDFGKPGESDSAAACAPWLIKEGNEWHMFYLGTPNAGPGPQFVPSFPYLTLKAKASALGGPWIKQPEVVPFSCKPNTFYSVTASPGHVVKQGDEYLMFFSAAMHDAKGVQRTLGIARTKDLNSPWTLDPEPILPASEQIENSSLYFEPANQTWFLFTNHIGLDGGEYTDAVWVYWSKDMNKWDARNKAVVLDGKNCAWSKRCIGMPSVIKVGKRLAVFYDAPGGGSASHMNRDIGLAWLELPLTPPGAQESEITVASYYFGNYHPGDPRNVKNKGKGWSEWELVKAAKPRFPGHQQPKVPLWGYADESDPKAMAQKIDAAADHGIDAFIFDWYYYDDGPFLGRPVDIGFLKAPNNQRLKFAFMWANHDWLDLHPYKRGTPQKLLYPGVVTPDTFDQICDHVIKNYFVHPSYWKIDGKPYFSFYDLTTLLKSFGSVDGTRAALDKFRLKAAAAGLPGLHLNAVVWGTPILPAEKVPADPARLVKDLGFDSVTSYVWIHHVGLPKLQTQYNDVRDKYFAYWDKAQKMFDVPYFPNVTMGWDPSPRTAQEDDYGNFGYPYMNTIEGNTPGRFREAMELAKNRLLAQPDGPRILNINCWNEWTEGSYLEPDVINGMKYLEAVREVFGQARVKK